MSQKTCHICGTAAIDVVPGYEVLQRVTSDCKPWANGGQLGVCSVCNTTQKIINAQWEQDISDVYEAYSIYHQGQGAEQAVFEQSSGQASSRSIRLLEQLQTNISLPQKGRLLDVGCGNGALLRAFNSLNPTWALAGTELSDKYKSNVESIDSVEKLYTTPPNEVPGTFDIITMVHLLEHIVSPLEFLESIQGKLTDDGFVVVEVPNHHQNPFDLLIIDHATHFSIETLTALLQKAGYEIVSASTEWVPKELSVVARKANAASSPDSSHTKDGFEAASKRLEWLQSTVDKTHQLSQVDSFGIFGTSIAGTWLWGELQDSVNFFVDEDLNRAGSAYLDRPVYHPNEIPSGSHVFLGLPLKLAESIVQRIAKPDIHYHLPLPIDT